MAGQIFLILKGCSWALSAASDNTDAGWSSGSVAARLSVRRCSEHRVHTASASELLQVRTGLGRCVHGRWECRRCSHYESHRRLLKTLRIWPSNPAPGSIPEKLKITFSQRRAHPCVHGSVIRGGQDLETTHVCPMREDWRQAWSTHSGHRSAARRARAPLATPRLGRENRCPEQ